MSISSEQHPHYALRGFAAVVGIVFVALVGVGIRSLAAGASVGLDRVWHDFLASHRSGSVDAVALLLNTVGGTLAMTIVTAVIVVGLFLLRRRREAMTIGLTVALGSAICSLIKIAVARPRPADGTLDILSDSFPSGHTTTAASLAIALALAFPRAWAWVLASLWIVAMALSRNYLLVHWLSDVVAGALLGASVALLVSGVVGEVSTSRMQILKEPSPDRASLPG